MSDDDDYLDDDDYFYIDDGPVAEADDLAEHTMHSPVLRDNDPSDDLAEYWSDWEYYSDDYYDEVPARNKQDMISIGGESRQTGGKRKSIANNGRRRKRRRKDSAGDIRGISFGERAGSEDDGTRSSTPIVVWRSKDAKNEPVTHQANGERVALLKDWREIFGTHSHYGEIGRNMKLKKRDPDHPVDTHSSVDGCRFMATRVPGLTRPNASPTSRRDLPDSNNAGSPKGRFQATWASDAGHPISKDGLRASLNMAGTAAGVSAAPLSESRLFIRSKSVSAAGKENAREEALSIESKPN